MSEKSLQVQRFLLGIGAPRSGTTWIYHNLRLSSEVYMPPVKELRYFKNSRSLIGKFEHREKTIKNIRIMDGDHDFLDRWTKTKDGDETKYSDLFGNKKFAGEITPVYSIMDCSEITKIYNALAKQRVDVFYMIRNPLFRDVSQIIFAMHRQKKRLEPYSLKEYRDFVDTAAFLKRSQYQKNYEKWQSVFGESVKIFYFDQLLKKPKVFFKKFCENYDISYDSARVKGMKMNKSGDKNRFQIKLPDELIAYLGERSIKNIENSTLYRNKIKVKWTEEIRVKMAMMQ